LVSASTIERVVEDSMFFMIDPKAVTVYTFVHRNFPHPIHH